MSAVEKGYECPKCHNIKEAVEFYELKIRLYDEKIEGICNYCKISALDKKIESDAWAKIHDFDKIQIV